MKMSFTFSSLGSKARSNVSWVLLAVLAVLLIFEVLVVKRSVDILLDSQRIEVTAKTTPVRVNFKLYDAIADRFNQQTGFSITPVTAADPFGRLKFESEK